MFMQGSADGICRVGDALLPLVPLALAVRVVDDFYCNLLPEAA
jgi:hypothetical protein